jgi:hypothetical protein
VPFLIDCAALSLAPREVVLCDRYALVIACMTLSNVQG